MIWHVPLLVLVGIAAGPVLATVNDVWLRRFLGWLVLAIVIYSAAINLADYSPVLRMIGICSVLLGAMKGLVYAEWVGPEKLPPTRYGIFALFWFGMDPASFRNRRLGLSWKNDVRLGALMMVAGTLAAWAVWAMEWRQILIMFVPMSVGFHFGALRVLKGGLRAGGFPVRTLFPNVLACQGVGDFWSRRWNVGYSQMMQRLIGRPVQAIAGKNVALMSVFVVSGFLHELAITLPVQSGFGLPTVYFTLHGLLTLSEKKHGRTLGKIPALLAVTLPLGLLFPPVFQSDVIERCLDVFTYIAGMLDGLKK